MKKLYSLLAIVLLMSGCAVKQEEQVDTVIESYDGEYSYAMPFESNHTRFHHGSKDAMEIGQGLIDISKEYFSVNDYLIKEGQVINDYEKEYLPLILRRESKENPIGLNPSKETELDLGGGHKVKGPFIINDLFEINFFTTGDKETLQGIAMALVVYDTIEDDQGRMIKIDDDVLYEIAINAGRKLESYLRKNTEVDDAPLLLAIFATNPYNQSVPGHFIAKGYFEKRQGQFEKVNHSWSVFPTNESAKKDATVHSQIISIKKAINGFIPEDIGMVAYGEYHDDKISNLIIDVTIQAKTFTEIKALNNMLAELIMSFDANSDVLVRIKLVDEIVAIIERPVGKKAKITMIGK